MDGVKEEVFMCCVLDARVIVGECSVKTVVIVPIYLCNYPVVRLKIYP